MNQSKTKSPIQVKQNIVHLRHLAYVAAEMVKIQCGWIPGTAWWELKLHLARSQWVNACHTNELRHRLQEFPGGKPDGEINKNWVTLMEIIAAAPDGPAFIQGLFGAFKPHLVSMYRHQLQITDAIVDSPTIDILEKAIIQEEQLTEDAFRLYKTWTLTEEEKMNAEAWKAYINELLVEIGEIHTLAEEELSQVKPYDVFRPSPIALRDDRFETSFRIQAPTDGIEREDDRYEVKVIMSYLKEMQAVETVATSLYEIRTMPWSFYYETSRHCWDEARHCMLGQRRFEQLGYDFTKIPSMNGNYAVRQLLDPLYRYAYITMVEEAGSMKGKREWVAELERRGKTLTARLVEYDLADERNHVNNGFRWIPDILKARKDTRTLEEVVEEAKKQRAQAFELIRLDHI